MNRYLKNIYTRLKLMITKSILESIDDSTKIQLVKVVALENEEFDLVERLQEYGLSTVPPEGSNAIIGSKGGIRDDSVILKTGYPQLRVKDKAEGDVTLWDIHNNKIELTADGLKITDLNGNALTGTSGKLEISSDEVVINGGSKGAARLDDTVSRTLSVPDLTAIGSAIAGLYLPNPSPVPPSAPVTLLGEAKISSSSSTVNIGD